MLDYGFVPDGSTDIATVARVTAVFRGRFRVMFGGEELDAYVSEKMRRDALTKAAQEAGLKAKDWHKMHESMAAVHFPTIGDFVTVQQNAVQQALQITALLPRKTAFYRPNYRGHAVGYVKTVTPQAVAANFDVVILLQSLNNDFSEVRLQRYLSTARQSGAQPLILLTKLDLTNDATDYIQRATAIAGGVPVMAVSAHSGAGMEQLKPYLTKGKTLAFLGSSGVGKSSLVNALAGEELMKVNAIREDDDKGRHTTTHRQLLRLANGVLVIDTPGMRELGMWDNDEGLSQTFEDVESLIAACRFSDCKHGTEPGCAVRAALENGTLTPKRLEQYMTLHGEAEMHKRKSFLMRTRDLSRRH